MRRKHTPSSKEQIASRFIGERRGRAAIRPLPSVASAASKVLRPFTRQFGPGLDQLKERWPEIVGEGIARWSSPDALVRQQGHSVLVIRARGSANAVIQAEARRILERVRQFSGRQAPTRIRVVQGQLAAPPDPVQQKITPAQPRSQNSEPVALDAQSRLLSALTRFDKAVKARGEE